MKEDYQVRFLYDDIYGVFLDSDDYEFKGTLTEVNAWLELKAKGYLMERKSE